MCPVQKEIYYSDQIDFYAFDVRLHLAGAETVEWLNYDVAMALFRECGFFYAEPLLRGTLEEVLYSKIYEFILFFLFSKH